MLAQYLDLAPQLQADNLGYVIIDVSNYDYTLIQPIGADVSKVECSIDGGDITGVTDGNATSATNFYAAAGITVSDGVTYVNSITSTRTVRFPVVGRYLKITASPTSMNKLLVMLAKIS